MNKLCVFMVLLLGCSGKQIPKVSPRQDIPVYRTESPRLQNRTDGIPEQILQINPDARNSWSLMNADGTTYCDFNYTKNSMSFSGQSIPLEGDFLETLRSFGFAPLCFYPDYGAIDFQVANTTTEGYAVYINDKKEIKYLVKQRSDLVVSLSDYLQTRVVSLPENTRIFESPSFGAKFIEAPSEVPFGIDSVSADWVKIHTTTMCGYEIENEITGWIKFREGHKVILDFYLGC